MQKKWNKLTPAARARLAERLRQIAKDNEARRKQLAIKKRKQPLRRVGRHVFVLNADKTTYRCLTCTKEQ